MLSTACITSWPGAVTRICLCCSLQLVSPFVYAIVFIMHRRHRGGFADNPRQPIDGLERPIFDWTEFRVQEVFRRADPIDDETDKKLSEVVI